MSRFLKLRRKNGHILYCWASADVATAASAYPALHESYRLFSFLLPGSSLQGVHRCVHEFCAIHHRRLSPLHESYGIHAHVLLTVLVHGLHVTHTAVGSFNCPVSFQAQWTSVYCLTRRTERPWVRIHLRA